MTHFLRFPNKAAFLAVMPAGFELQGETGYPLPDGVLAISILGEGCARGGRWDDQGNVIEAPEILPGFHVNALGELPEAWAPFVIEPPSSPIRTF